MTAATLGWFIAGVCITAFIILWFAVSYKEVSAKKKSLDIISEQVQMHRRLHMQERGGENDAAAQLILENKLMVYREVEKSYNSLIKKPMNRIPAYIMGFRPIGKERVIWYTSVRTVALSSIDWERLRNAQHVKQSIFALLLRKKP